MWRPSPVETSISEIVLFDWRWCALLCQTNVTVTKELTNSVLRCLLWRGPIACKHITKYADSTVTCQYLLCFLHNNTFDDRDGVQSSLRGRNRGVRALLKYYFGGRREFEDLETSGAPEETLCRRGRGLQESELYTSQDLTIMFSQ